MSYLYSYYSYYSYYYYFFFESFSFSLIFFVGLGFPSLCVPQLSRKRDEQQPPLTVSWQSLQDATVMAYTGGISLSLSHTHTFTLYRFILYFLYFLFLSVCLSVCLSVSLSLSLSRSIHTYVLIGNCTPGSNVVLYDKERISIIDSKIDINNLRVT